MDPTPSPLQAVPAPVPSAPRAERRPTVLETHGDRRVDDWFWLRDRDDPAVVEHLRAENAWTDYATAHLAPLREELFAEIRARIVETDLSVPVRKDRWWYYQRTVEGQAYAIHCRLPVESPDRDPATPPTAPEGSNPGETWADEEILLDENALAEGHAYFDVANLSVSPGGGRLALAVDTTGDERFTLRFRELVGSGHAGEDPAEEIEGTSYGLAWANDDRTVFYTRPDAANRPHQLWRHRVGTPPADDDLLFEEADERFHLGVGRTKDGVFVVLELQSKVTSEAHILAADDPGGEFRLVEPRRQGVEYGLEHHRDHLLIMTNDGAENFRLVAAPDTDPVRARWREVIPHRPDVRLDGVDIFAGHLVAYERLEGVARIRVHTLGIDPAGGAGPWGEPLGEGRLVPAPELPSTSWGGPNPEFGSTVLRYEYSSLVTPRSVSDLDLVTGETVLRKRQVVLGGYEPGDYVTERVWATAPDGTRVPISIVRRADTPRDGTAPGLLYGYGSYEASMDPVFSSIRLSLLDRGFVYAIAHVRGGGEMGRRWYEEGKMLAKANTFTDFVACAATLVEQRFVDPAQLVGRGGSAGGLLIGAVANLAPDRFRALVAEVPFVDCLTTILDETLPLTVIEWEEWGNPGADPAIYEAMKAYTPYDGVRPGRYPDILATAGLEDPRVGFWEPAKWVQKLRRADPEGRILLKVELEAGHAGPSGRYEAWKEEAFVLAFILDEVGLAT